MIYDNIFLKLIMIYNKVANATHAVANVDDYSGSARLLAATTLRQTHIHCLMVSPFFCFILRNLYGWHGWNVKCIFCRNVLGTLTLGEILSQRERIASEMQVEMDHHIIITIIIIIITRPSRPSAGWASVDRRRVQFSWKNFSRLASLVCRKKHISSKWILCHSLMIALFSEKMMWIFPKNLLLKVVATTLLL